MMQFEVSNSLKRGTQISPLAILIAVLFYVALTKAVNFYFLTQSFRILGSFLHLLMLILSATLMNLRHINPSSEVVYIHVELQILDLDDSLE